MSKITKAILTVVSTVMTYLAIFTIVCALIAVILDRSITIEQCATAIGLSVIVLFFGQALRPSI